MISSQTLLGMWLLIHAGIKRQTMLVKTHSHAMITAQLNDYKTFNGDDGMFHK